MAGGTLAAQVSEELPAGCAQPPVGGSVNYTLQPDGTLAEEETPDVSVPARGGRYWDVGDFGRQ